MTALNKPPLVSVAGLKFASRNVLHVLLCDFVDEDLAAGVVPPWYSMVLKVGIHGTLDQNLAGWWYSYPAEKY